MPTLTITPADIDRALRCGGVQSMDNDATRPEVITLVREDGCREDWPLAEIATLSQREQRRLSAPFDLSLYAPVGAQSNDLSDADETPENRESLTVLFSRALVRVRGSMRSQNLSEGVSEFQSRSDFGRSRAALSVGADMRQALLVMGVDLAALDIDKLTERLGYATIATAGSLIDETAATDARQQSLIEAHERVRETLRAQLAAAQAVVRTNEGIAQAANKWRTATDPVEKLEAFKMLMGLDSGPLPEADIEEVDLGDPDDEQDDSGG